MNLAGMVNLPANLRFGTLLRVVCGIPFNITTGQDNNHDSVANDRPAGLTRNTENGPGLLQLDARQSCPACGGRRIATVAPPTSHFSVDAFNVLNHTNYPSYVGVITSPHFDKANTALPAITLQLSVTYRF